MILGLEAHGSGLVDVRFWLTNPPASEVETLKARCDDSRK